MFFTRNRAQRRGSAHGVFRRAGFAGLVLIALLTLVLAPVFTFPVGSAAQGSCRELIVNGGFESGHDGWVEYSSQNYELIDPFYPHTGVKGVWLGANNTEEDWIAQTLVLPADAASLNLSYWWSLFTEENPGAAFDIMRVQLLRVDDVLITTLATVNNESAESWAWNLASADLSAYAGQTVKLRFYAKNDANNPSSFFVDDVSLLACPDANTPTPTPTSGTATATQTATPTASPRPTASPWPRIFLPVILR